MPYIIEEGRKILSVPLNGLLKRVCSKTHPGVLNYLFYKIVLKALGVSPNYERFNAIIGALESCKLEVYRRMISPYEDKKIKENGDVHDFDDLPGGYNPPKQGVSRPKKPTRPMGRIVQESKDPKN